MMLLSGPNISGREWDYVKECLDTAWVSSVGSYVTKFEEMTAKFAGTRYAVACSSGTTALHISLLLAGVQPDDYVITSNLTFVASLNSISYTGAYPLLVDIKEDTWQMDLDLLEEYLDKNVDLIKGICVHKPDGRTIRAILPVHVLGNMVNMDKLAGIARKFSLIIVEDATESLGSYYKGRHSGSFGLMGCFSYNGNKIITTGGGGMIVTDNEELAKKAKHLTTQAKADPFEYFHDEIGYNYRLVNVLAAIGVAQMEQLPGFIQRKKEIDSLYKHHLSGIGDIQFQKINPEIDPNCWLFTFRTANQKELLTSLNEKKMQSRPFWVPMNQLPMFKNELYIQNDDIAGKIYKECLSVPCSTYLANNEIEQVCEVIQNHYVQTS